MYAAKSADIGRPSFRNSSESGSHLGPIGWLSTRAIAVTPSICLPAGPPRSSGNPPRTRYPSHAPATTPHPGSCGHAATRPNGMLHLMRYRSLLTAAAGGAAALADVAAARRAHLGPAGQAQRGVGDPALMRLDHVGRTGGHGRRVSGTRALRSPGLAGRRSRPRLLPRRGLRPFLGVDDIPDRSGVLAVQHRRALGDRHDAPISPLLLCQPIHAHPTEAVVHHRADHPDVAIVG